MSKFDELDAAIVSRIQRGGPHPTACSECLLAAVKVMRADQDAFRVVDGRMTALKKRGDIFYIGRAGVTSHWGVRI